MAAILTEREHELAAFSSQPLEQHRVRHRNPLKHGGKEEAEDRTNFKPHLSTGSGVLFIEIFFARDSQEPSVPLFLRVARF